jgi:hypothetical protein
MHYLSIKLKNSLLSQKRYAPLWKLRVLASLMQFPILVGALAIVPIMRVHFMAGLLWLGYAVCSFWLLSLIINFSLWRRS